MAYFADINVLQVSVATYARRGGIFNMNLIENLPINPPVKNICELVKIWQNYVHESVAPFFGPPCNSCFRLVLVYATNENIAKRSVCVNGP